MWVNKVSEVMGRRRMNVSEMARAAGIGRQTAHRLYHGDSDVTMDVVGRVCQALGVDVGELFEWVPDGEAAGDAESRRNREPAGAGV